MIILSAVVTWKLGRGNRQSNTSTRTGKVEVATEGIKYDKKLLTSVWENHQNKPRREKQMGTQTQTFAALFTGM